MTKSTVPVGTNRKVAEVVRAANPSAAFDVASNPEFLREGAAIDDFMRPDRVVVGVETKRARKVMGDIYRPLFLRDFPIVYTGLESAEMIKYAANAFLATKITFINEIAALCEKVGADIKDVAKGMGGSNRARYSNPRIDSLIDQAMATMDDGVREKIVQQAMRMAMDDVPVVQLHLQKNIWATRKGLTYEARVDEETLAMGVKPTK